MATFTNDSLKALFDKPLSLDTRACKKQADKLTHYPKKEPHSAVKPNGVCNENINNQ